LRYLVDVMGPSSVLLGSDYPFPLGEERVGSTIRSCGFAADVEGSLLGDNAVEFLGIAPGG
jgi:aminocarboxymuconate-semialdehyde decarboxylase